MNRIFSINLADESERNIKKKSFVVFFGYFLFQGAFCLLVYFIIGFYVTASLLRQCIRCMLCFAYIYSRGWNGKETLRHYVITLC